MENIPERLKQFAINQGFNNRDFGKKLGLSDSQISMIFNGKRPIRVQFLQKVKEVFPELDMEWLINGSIAGFHESVKLDELEEPSAIYATDPMEKAFLEYLKRPAAQELIENSVKKILNIQLGSDPASILKFAFGEKDSELPAKVNTILFNMEKNPDYYRHLLDDPDEETGNAPQDTKDDE